MGGEAVADVASENGDGLQLAPGGDSKGGASHDDAVCSRELIRLIGRALLDLGYRGVAESLQAESGIAVEDQAVSRFRSDLLSGEWAKVDACLDSLVCKSPEDKQDIKFEVFEQQFLEALAAGQSRAALHVLRNRLTPLKRRAARVHHLSSLVFCRSAEQVQERAPWLGGRQSREALVSRIEKRLSPAVVVPSGRLHVLMEKAIELQLRECLYHNGSGRISLLEDHHCSPDGVPKQVSRVLEGHTDEVWYLEFSHGGDRIVSASKDRTAIIWDVRTGEKLHTLRGHSDGLNYVAWSPNDKYLLTCGGDRDKSAVLWDTTAGVIVRVFDNHDDGVTACAWTPDGARFVSGSTDQTMLYCEVSGDVIHTWQNIRPTSLAITGKSLVVACHERKLRVYDLDHRDVMRFAQEKHSITSLAVTKDGKRALLNLLAAQELHLWDLEQLTILQTYGGHIQTQFALRACFGGRGETFVVSGSEDHTICLWHRQSSKLLTRLRGHTAPVNAVCWNPTDHGMFASCSDDHSVRLWTAQGPAPAPNGITGSAAPSGA